MNPVVALAAILSTLHEVKEGPESSFYLPFMGQMNVDTFNQLVGVLIKMGLAKNSGHYLTFTQPAPGSNGEKLLDTVVAMGQTI